MKYRTNFVSNSSSSSYICEICGEDYSGWDAGLEEAGMVECEKGHVFCEGHLEIEQLVSDDVKEERILSIMKDDECSREEAEETYEDIEGDYEDRYGIDKTLCPICQLKEIIDSDLAAYTLYKLGITREVAEEMFRSEFKNLEAFEKMKMDTRCGNNVEKT